MSNAIGWSREDLESPQAVEALEFGNMLHPVHLESNPQHHQQQQTAQPSHTGDDGFQGWQGAPTPAQSAKVSSPGPAPFEATYEGITPGSPPRILGLRRTTFFLTVSNILLAIGLIVLGVVQNQALRTSSGGPTGLEAQGSCPSSSATPSGTSASASAAPTCSPEADKICFATDKSITTAVALGEVIPECPLPDGNSNYTVPGTKLTFKRECETDYPNADMGTFPVLTMADCIHLCAQLNLYPASALGRCVGASWVYADGPQGKGISFCYPKSEMKTAKKRAATESAVLIVE
ncbi:hypothetical protein C8A00DRAFT_38367 [Chaetomidium leptoderma]|uniref:Uncharacterized protein n=1 Tax=Chaetomidium leptoderma TaxID=669021 RepID=A0AAN6VDU0_9PEZI|nr:hypothetical protein C8A00DRAFT_38367 [Chaetomidium leptoderma]